MNAGLNGEKIILHHCHESRSMKSLWLLEELGLEYDLVVHGFGGDLRSSEYLSIHPLGRVPCLVIGSQAMFESGAIAEYLCELSENTDLFCPSGSRERAEWLQWLHYSETITVHLANLTQQFVALRDSTMRSPVVIKLDKRRLEKALGVVEKHLKDRNYMVTNHFTAVDIGIGYALYIAKLFTDMSAFPKCEEYMKRLSIRPAFKASQPEPNDPIRFYSDAGYRLEG